MRNLVETYGMMRSVLVKGDGPPLLLLHGFTGSIATWVPFIDAWSQKFRVIAVDIVGHGNTRVSEKESCYSMEAEADALIALLDYFNIDQTHIVGYSMGARLGLYMKVFRPDRVGGLLMESGSPGLSDKEQRLARRKKDEELAGLLRSKGVEPFVDYWESIPLFMTQKIISQEKRLRIREERLGQTADGLANSLLGMGTGVQPPLWEYLKGLKGPVHFVAGQLDSKFVELAKQMVRMTPASFCHIVTHSGHAIHVEQSQVFDRIVNESFYQSITEG